MRTGGPASRGGRMSQYADVVFGGGALYTSDSSGRRLIPPTAADGRPATSAAVRGGVIVAVGDAADGAITDLKGPRTELVDLRGRALLPGFQDAHVHPAFAGVTMIRCDLDGAEDLAGALDRIRVYAAAQPDREWVDGSGWRMEWFPGGTPSRELLDSVVPDRPAYLTNR